MRRNSGKFEKLAMSAKNDIHNDKEQNSFSSGTTKASDFQSLRR